MSIATNQIVEHSGGTRKQIEMESMDQIFDNLQITQYQYPVKSTVRELVSNGVDSIKERNIAVEILTGKAKVEDYYEQREGYESSNFDPSYYDLKWLDTSSKVQIIYEVGGQLGKDRVRIIDPGVGLGKNRDDGKSRLEGYFKLAYSSKRNLKAQFALGKFGLGAKSPLSTNVPFYTVISRYNGKEYHFNVYSSYIQSTVPSMSIVDGKMHANNDDLLYEGTEYEIKAYWLPTQRRNGVEIIIESKKSKKNEYEEAVKNQLLYFQGVEFFVLEDGVKKEIPVSAKILYEDEFLVVSDNKQYSKPHLVINGVNYGYIDFAELELQEKFGNVGIKVSLDEVAVTQSRETVIWNEKTKALVLARFKQATDIAQKLVQEKLQEKDLFVWFQTWLKIRNSKYSEDSNDPINQLAHIVDISQLQPAYSVNPKIIAGSVNFMFPGMQVQRIELGEGKRAGTLRKKLKRTDVMFISEMSGDVPIVLSRGKPPLSAIRYYATINPKGFYLIRYPSHEILGLEEVEKDDEEKDNLKAYGVSAFVQEILKGRVRLPDSWKQELEGIHGHDLVVFSKVASFLRDLRKSVIGYMEASEVPVKATDIVVPEEFSWTEDEEVERETEVQQKLDAVSPAERRKLEERVVAFTPRGTAELPAAKLINSKYTPVNIFEYQKIEPKLVEVQNLEGDVYYGFNDEESRQAMELAALITRPGDKQFAMDMTTAFNGNTDKFNEFMNKQGMEHSKVYDSRYSQYYLPGSPITLLKIAKDQEKNYRMYKPIQDFFIKLENYTLSMSDHLVRWHTARRIDEEIKNMSFLENFQVFYPELYDKYKRVKAYHLANFRDLKALSKNDRYFGITEEVLSDLIELHEKLVVVQNFVKENPNEQAKAGELIKTMFDVEAHKAYGIDEDIFSEYLELVEYTKMVAPLLSNIPQLKDATLSISEGLEREIRFYLNAKGL